MGWPRRGAGTGSRRLGLTQTLPLLLDERGMPIACEEEAAALWRQMFCAEFGGAADTMPWQALEEVHSYILDALQDPADGGAACPGADDAGPSDWFNATYDALCAQPAGRATEEQRSSRWPA